jgi:hypothetical protein
LASSRPLALALGLGAAAAANLASRRFLRWFFRQTLFADPRGCPPFAAAFRPPGSPCRLTPSNLRPALLASGSIPLVMEGVRDIAGAAPGVYRDGGAVDYHLDVPFGLGGRGIVLFPAGSTSTCPGGTRKPITWTTCCSWPRRPSSFRACPTQRFPTGGISTATPETTGRASTAGSGQPKPAAGWPTIFWTRRHPAPSASASGLFPLPAFETPGGSVASG